MARVSITIGYNQGETETSPGVWKPTIVEKEHQAMVLSDEEKRDFSDAASGELSINHRVSVAVPDHFSQAVKMVYVVLYGTKWSVKSFKYIRPRVTISLGEEYHG